MLIHFDHLRFLSCWYILFSWDIYRVDTFCLVLISIVLIHFVQLRYLSCWYIFIIWDFYHVDTFCSVEIFIVLIHFVWFRYLSSWYILCSWDIYRVYTFCSVEIFIVLKHSVQLKYLSCWYILFSWDIWNLTIMHSIQLRYLSCWSIWYLRYLSCWYILILEIAIMLVHFDIWDSYHVDTIVWGSNPDLLHKRLALYQLNHRRQWLLVRDMIMTSAQQRFLSIWFVMFHRDKSSFIKRCWCNLLLSKKYLLVDTVCLGMAVDMKDLYIGFNRRCLSWNVQWIDLTWHFEMFVISF